MKLLKPVNDCFPLPNYEHLRDDLGDPGRRGKHACPPKSSIQNTQLCEWLLLHILLYECLMMYPSYWTSLGEPGLSGRDGLPGTYEHACPLETINWMIVFHFFFLMNTCGVTLVTQVQEVKGRPHTRPKGQCKQRIDWNEWFRQSVNAIAFVVHSTCWPHTNDLFHLFVGVQTSVWPRL